MALVLCTGTDPALIRTRQLILQKAGHEVVIAMDEPSVAAVCQQQAFDVVVIGQAVSGKAKQQIMSLIRKNCPSAAILELYRFSTARVLEDADSWLEVPADAPGELAERVTSLAGRRRKRWGSASKMVEIKIMFRFQND